MRDAGWGWRSLTPHAFLWCPSQSEVRWGHLYLFLPLPLSISGCGCGRGCLVRKRRSDKSGYRRDRAVHRRIVGVDISLANRIRARSFLASRCAATCGAALFFASAAATKRFSSLDGAGHGAGWRRGWEEKLFQLMSDKRRDDFNDVLKRDPACQGSRWNVCPVSQRNGR